MSVFEGCDTQFARSTQASELQFIAYLGSPRSLKVNDCIDDTAEHLRNVNSCMLHGRPTVAFFPLGKVRYLTKRVVRQDFA